MNDIPLVTLGMIALAIVFRLVAGGMDAGRVRSYIEQRGGRLVSSQWAPFGKGWFGEKSDRIYKVRYLDGEGNEHEAGCKTSLFTGVYFTEDQIVRYGRSHSSGCALVAILQIGDATRRRKPIFRQTPEESESHLRKKIPPGFPPRVTLRFKPIKVIPYRG